MRYAETTATHKIARLGKRIRAVAGGTAASKTISILLVLISECQLDKVPTVTTVISESMPHLKKGAMRDFLDIMKSHGLYVDAAWNRTDSVYTFASGSIMEFVGLDTPEKAAGPRRDRAFINEANHISLAMFNQIEVRTRQFIFLDWNPTNEFWFYTDVLPTRGGDTDFITLTYKDNEALDVSTISSIEARKNNKNWWDVYGLGKLGVTEGRVYKDWAIIDEIPHEARLERRGLDYGYSNDPTTIIDIYYCNGGYILDEQLYQKGMSNKAIADFLLNLPEPQTLVRPDSAEPKSNDELLSYGINLIPSTKGAGSVLQGIQNVQSQRISITSRSSNLIKEYRNYLWQVDRDGKIINEPEHQFSHTMDAVRYGMEGINEQATVGKAVFFRRTDKVTGYGRTYGQATRY